MTDTQITSVDALDNKQLFKIVRAHARHDADWKRNTYVPYWKARVSHSSDLSRASLFELIETIPADSPAFYLLGGKRMPETQADDAPAQEVKKERAPVQEKPKPKVVDLGDAIADLDVFLDAKWTDPLKAGLDALNEKVREAEKRAENAAPITVNPGEHSAKVIKTVTLHSLVGGKDPLRKKVKVDVYDHPYAPKVDPDFIPGENLARIIMASNLGQNVALFGDRGTGKSSLVRYIAAILGRPYFEISFHEEMSSYELWGQRGIGADGATGTWDEGVLLKAIKTPGAVIDLSEVSVSRPGLVMSLNAPTERKTRAINIDGVVHRVHPTVSFFATTNDNGSGENAGRFHGVRPMNDATRSRFTWVPVELPGRDQLAEQLANAAGIPASAADMLAEYECDIRAQVKSGECEATPGMRALIAWGELAREGLDSPTAYDMAVRHVGSSEDAAVWTQRMNAMFNHRGFQKAAKGEAEPRTKNGFEEIAGAASVPAS